MAFKRSAVRLRLAPLHWYRMNTSDFALIILSAMLHASWNFFAKTSAADKIATLWFGWLVTGITMTPVAIYLTDFSSFSWKWIPLFVSTGIVHAIYLYLLGSAYKIGEMSVIYPVSRGIGVLLFCTICFAIGIESIGYDGFVGIFVLVTGIMLAALKNLRSLEKSEVVKLSGKVGLCISCYSIIDKLSVSHIPSIFYMSTMFIISPIILAPIMVTSLKEETKNVITNYKLYSSAIGMVGFITYLMILIAMKASPASYVVALREISIVFGSVLGVWLLKEECGKRKIIGVILIMIGAYIIKAS